MTQSALTLSPEPQPAAAWQLPAPAFSLLDADGLGWKQLSVGLRLDYADLWLAEQQVRLDGATLTLTGRYPDYHLRETLTVTRDTAGAVIIRRQIANERHQPVVLRGAFLDSPAPAGGPVLPQTGFMDLRYAHFDNVRTEKFPWCRMEFPYVRPLPMQPLWLGQQENQAPPVLLLSDMRATRGLLIGQLDQTRSRLRFHLCAAPRRQFATCRADWDLTGDGILLHKDQPFDLEPIYLSAIRDFTWETALDPYFDHLAAHHDFSLQTRNPLHHTVFYCSWNYGIARDFTQDSLLATARKIDAELPEVRYFMIDGGWQSREHIDTPDTSQFYRHDHVYHQAHILPDGMDGLARHLRELGLIPAIWWSPSVDMTSTLVAEHPEWLARDAAGGPHRINNSGFLDYSLPDVQDYLHSVFDTIFHKWGYAAMKMDFWSQGAESDHIRFRQGTAIQWRDWLLKTIQSYLPDHGFLMTCVATAMGNPFVTQYAQTYRACIDIGAYRSWKQHLHASCWVQPMLGLHGRTFGLMNVDGFGVSEHVSDAENLHRLTYTYITQGSLEIDGRLEHLQDRHLDWMRRMCRHPDRGHRVRCPDAQAYTGEPFPAVLYVDYPVDSATYRRGIAKHIALFNWGDSPKMVGACAHELGLAGDVTLRCFWTDALRHCPDGHLMEPLPPRSARLYELAHP